MDSYVPGTRWCTPDLSVPARFTPGDDGRRVVGVSSRGVWLRLSVSGLFVSVNHFGLFLETVQSLSGDFSRFPQNAWR